MTHAFLLLHDAVDVRNVFTFRTGREEDGVFTRDFVIIVDAIRLHFCAFLLLDERMLALHSIDGARRFLFLQALRRDERDTTSFDVGVYSLQEFRIFERYFTGTRIRSLLETFLHL